MPYDVETKDAASSTDAATEPGKSRDSATLNRRRKRLLLGFAAIAAACGAGAGAWWILEASHFATTDNAYVGADSAQIGAMVSGRLATVSVEETMFVHRGDVLATIDPEDAVLNLERAEADYRRTMQRVEQYFAQEASLASQIKAYEADVNRAEAEFARRQNLSRTGAVSEEELAAAKAQFEAASANLASASASLDAQRALTRGETLVGHPETRAARAAVATARLSLERTIIRSPIDGVVAQKSAQIGQRIEIGQPLMSIVPVQDAFVDANFKEGQLARVRPGQKVELVSDLYGEKIVYRGWVEGVGGGTGSAFAVIPAQNATGNWIKVVQRVPVRIRLDKEELARNPLRVGVSMKAKIDLRTGDGEAA